MFATIIAAHCTLRRGVRSWGCSRPSAQVLLSARAGRRLRVERAARTGSSTPTTTSIRRVTRPRTSSGSWRTPAARFRLAPSPTGRRVSPSSRWTVASMTTPGIWWDSGEDGGSWARDCNEFGARMARDFPGLFGMFAAIPLPDIEGSMREISYALDTLKLDGIGLLTSYAGKPLGDPSFAPV